MTKRPLLLPVLLVACLLTGSEPSFAQEGGNAANAYASVATGLETRLSAVEDQLRALTGKVEQLDYALRRLDTALQKMQADADMRLTKLESAPPPTAPAAPPVTVPSVAAPSPVPSAPASESEHEDEEESPPTPQPPVEGTLGGVKVRDGKVTGAVGGGKTPALPAKPADYGLTAKELYGHSFDLLRQANYDEAEKAFKSFIDKYPQDKLIDNAKYWHAETFYVRGKFNAAAVSFAEAYQQNPKGTKAPDSLLKMAMSLSALDKKEDACGALTALKSKYPNASPTVRARADQERVKLKCK